LNAVGLPELVTHSLPEYESLALELAKNPARLAALRARLAANRRTHPLFDTSLFARHLEAGYKLILDRLASGLPPDHVDIDRTAAA
jgi:predicted O-linked N-acetylglucosamine transferase (SPINDLY family)